MCEREREEEKERYHAWIQNLSREGGGARTFCGNVDSHAYENSLDVKAQNDNNKIVNSTLNISQD